MNQWISITDFGAVADTGEVRTKAIQQAIDAADSCQGTVVIPAGTFMTGTLNLKGADLYLEKGAVLLGSPNREDYTANGYLHCEFGETYSLLYAIDQRNCTVYGQGTIDCAGRNFFDFSGFQPPEHLKNKFHPYQLQETTAPYSWRPNQPIFFHNCTHVKVRDITILDAPCWTLTFSQCRDVEVRGITNMGHPRVANNDAIHVSASRDVIIADCNLSSADDCIAISSITNWSVPCENITVTNCILRSFSKAIVLGYSHSIVRNVTISNCQIHDSNRGLCIMPAAKTGLVENVVVSGLRIDTRVRAGNWWGNGEPILMESLPYTTKDHVDHTAEINARDYKVTMRNIMIRDLICTSENAGGIVGLDNGENISLDRVWIQLKESENLSLKGNVLDTAPAEEIFPVPEGNCILYINGVKADLHHVSGKGISGEEGTIVMA